MDYVQGLNVASLVASITVGLMCLDFLPVRRKRYDA